MKQKLLQTLSSGTLLLIAMMGGNVLNLFFNAYLGRILTLENYGLVTFTNSLWNMLFFILIAVGVTINHQTSFLIGQQAAAKAHAFMRNIRTRTIYYGLLASFLGVMLAPLLAPVFKVPDNFVFISLSLVISLQLYVVVTKAFLHGSFRFGQVAFLTILEPSSKLLLAYLLIQNNLSSYVYLSIPGSILIVAIATTLIDQISIGQLSEKNTHRFPFLFFAAAAITGFATNAFLQMDIMLAKYYLSPADAGRYALLSMIGKMLYFLGSLINTFTITLVARHLGSGRNPSSILLYVFWSTALSLSTAYLALIFFGPDLLPLLFGTRILEILPYINNYAVGITLYTLANVLVSYHLAAKRYLFPAVSLTSSLFLLTSTIFQHSDISQIANAVLYASSYHFFIILLLHFGTYQGKFILSNLLDLLDLFRFHQQPESTGLKVLILNWRDTKHQYAGGAEVYLHELAKRWVAQGVQVTQFCGNDGHAPRHDLIDGVQIIRRGGFYTVYLWAFIYYTFRLHKQYHVIIDTQNGIPFFTPLYAKEKIYCLMFHVHQEVFRTSLSPLLSWIARFLEEHLMRVVYRPIEFLTISDSSKTAIRELGLGTAGIHLIHPGIDLQSYTEAPKAWAPTVLSVGRLKDYKRIDLLIRAARIVRKEFPAFRLIIAGDGENKNELQELTEQLGLYANVVFKGKVTEAEKIKLYQQAWVFVNPSMMEGWGITSIEANACGTPIIASDVPGLRDSVAHQQSGLLITDQTPENFAQAIIELLSNTDLRQNMSTSAKDWAQNFSWDQSSQKSLQLIRELFENDNPPDFRYEHLQNWEGRIAYEQ